MYPTIVIALVHHQRSMVDTYDLGIISSAGFHRSPTALPERDILDGVSATGSSALTEQNLEQGGCDDSTKAR